MATKGGKMKNPFFVLVFIVVFLVGCGGQPTETGTGSVTPTVSSETRFVQAGDVLNLHAKAWIDAAGTDLIIHYCGGGEYANGGIRINVESTCFEVISGSGNITINYVEK